MKKICYLFIGAKGLAFFFATTGFLSEVNALLMRNQKLQENSLLNKHD